MFKNQIAKMQGKLKPKTRPGQNRAPEWKNKNRRNVAKRQKNKIQQLGSIQIPTSCFQERRLRETKELAPSPLCSCSCSQLAARKLPALQCPTPADFSHDVKKGQKAQSDQWVRLTSCTQQQQAHAWLISQVGRIGSIATAQGSSCPPTAALHQAHSGGGTRCSTRKPYTSFLPGLPAFSGGTPLSCVSGDFQIGLLSGRKTPYYKMLEHILSSQENSDFSEQMPIRGV